MHQATVESPFGTLRLTATDGAITRVDWVGTDDKPAQTPLLRLATEQLEAYFAHEITAFDLPVAPEGNAFQRAVCAEMQRIPFGETRTYGAIAKVLGEVPQQVGAACGGNSIPVIIPCHRVVGADGLGGFSAPGGVETKVALLRHEGAYSLLI